MTYSEGITVSTATAAAVAAANSRTVPSNTAATADHKAMHMMLTKQLLMLAAIDGVAYV
jgi:hypothetical protein